MAEDRIRKGHCPECGPDRNSDIVADHEERHDDDESGTWGYTNYRILKCRGCESVYYQKSTVFSEEMEHRQDPITGEWESFLPEKVVHWPAPTKRSQPDWTITLWFEHDWLSDLLDDVYGTMDADLRVPAAVAARTTFDAASAKLGVDPTLNFGKKLDALVNAGHIGAEERKSLEVLTDAGGAAAHRGWKPTPDQLDILVSTLEAFLHRAFILQKKTEALKSQIPLKPEKTKTGQSR